MSSRAAAELRASTPPPGSVCSYSLPVVFSQAARACQYSALNRQMQLPDPGTHGSSQTRSGAPPPPSPPALPPTLPPAPVTWTALDSAAVTSAATSVSGRAQRRRSTASSKLSTAVPAGKPPSVAITGRTMTVSRKFALYWIQSQTTRAAARSTSDRQSASTSGVIAARAPADSRSRRTARMSISTRGPSC